MNLFECKIRCEKVAENGLTKSVTEQYLIDALSFTEAEARIIEQMQPYITGEFLVTDIKRVSYEEVLFNDNEVADKWFKCKLVFITIDERTGAEKKTSSIILVQASDINEAVKKIDECMKAVEYRQLEVRETAIIDVFIYKK